MSASRFGGMFGVWLAGWLGMAAAMAAPLPFEDGFEPGASGVLLEGAGSGLAQEALTTYGPYAAKSADIQDDLLLTRLDAVIAPGVTVSQVNAALAAEQASIVAMRPGLPLLTLRVPRQSEVAGLQATADRLVASSAFVIANLARQAEVQALPPADPDDTNHRQRLAHLLPSRFPAAWNVSRLAAEGCESRRVRIMVPDIYHPDVPPRVSLVLSETGHPVIGYPGGIGFFNGIDPTTESSRHGYDMLGVLASRFDEFNATGAVPLPQCLDLQPISVAGLTHTDQWLALDGKLKGGEKVIVSRSISFPNRFCPKDVNADCTPSHFDRARDGLEALAVNALLSAAVIVPHRDDVLLINAAGNRADHRESLIYSGFARSLMGSGPNLLSALASQDKMVDAMMRDLMTDGRLWDPAPDRPAFPLLRLTENALSRLSQLRGLLRVPPQLVPLPIIMVGAGTTTDDATKMRSSFYSSLGSDVSAPADPIYLIDRMYEHGGTSSATPQVAGLAAYLWLISPELRELPTVVTRRAIIDNTAANEIWPIDAYASVLSTDRDVLPAPSDAPVRLALLDLDEDGDFDEIDIGLFIRRFQSPDAKDAPSYGREDLNGDGLVGGEGQSRFDLDRVGSVRFGLTDYSSVTQQIEGQTVSFSESSVTDLEILCYYAYSALYTGDAAERAERFGNACVTTVGPEVVIDFAAAQVVISGNTALMLEYNYPARPENQDFRLWRMDLRTSQLSGPEFVHAEGTVPLDFKMTSALMPSAQGRSPVLATWYVRGAVERLEDNSFAQRFHVWARYFDPDTQAWQPAIELGSFLDNHTSLPSLDMAVDARGNAMVLWVPPITPDDSLRRATYSYRSATSGQWSAPVPVADVPNHSSEYAIAAGNGVVTLAWSPYIDANDSTDFRLRARRFEVATATWGEETILANERGAKFTLGMDAQGGAVAVWNDNGDEYVSNYSMQDGAWTVPFSLGPVNPQANLPTRLTLDAAGNAVLHSLPPIGSNYSYREFYVSTNAWPLPRREIGYFSDAPFLGPHGGFTVARQPYVPNIAVLTMKSYVRGQGYKPTVTLASYAAREAEVRPVSAMGADGRGVVVWQALKREDAENGLLREVIERRAKVIAPTLPPVP